MERYEIESCPDGRLIRVIVNGEKEEILVNNFDKSKLKQYKPKDYQI